MKVHRTFLGFGAALLVSGAGMIAAYSQQPPAARIRGTINAVAGNTLAITARNGDHVSVHLADHPTIRAIVKASLADIRPDSYVGVTSEPQPDGTLRAIEIHIIPESRRGSGGHGPHDLTPTSTMTNGAVAQAVPKVDGTVLTVKYRDGEKAILVTPQTAIVTYADADASDLKPDAKVFISGATRKEDGTFEASSINVGRDGITPPM